MCASSLFLFAAGLHLVAGQHATHPQQLWTHFGQSHQYGQPTHYGQSPQYGQPYSTGSEPFGHTHTTGPVEEIKKAGTRALVGILLFVFAFPVLWFNEQRAAKMWQLFGRAAKMARANVPTDSIQPDNDGRMVHVTGMTSTKEVLRDSALDISVTDCAKLRREVEMYQWVEKEEKEEKDTSNGGKETITTYSYEMQWASEAVDSSSFQDRSYENPAMPLKSDSWQASAVSLGAFHLPATLIGRLCNYVELQAAAASLMVAGRSFSQIESGMYATMGSEPPTLGDMRIKLERVPCGDTTVFALQDGDSFAPLEFGTEVGQDMRAVRAQGNSEPFLKKGGEKGDEEDLMSGGEGGCCEVCSAIGKLVESGEEVFQIAEAKLTVKEIFRAAQKKESFIHRVLQLVGFLMLVGGLDLGFQFVPALFRIIPFVGTWIQFFGNFFAHIAALLLGAFCWLVTVALAWLWARPLKTVILLGIAALCVVVPTMMSASQP